MLRALTLALTLATAPLAADTPADASKLVRHLLAELDEVREAIRGIAEPEGGFLFGTDAEDHQDDLDAALDRALAVIGVEMHGETVARARALDEGLAEAERQRADLLFDRRTATDAELGIVDRLLLRETARGSAADLSERLAQVERDIAALKSARTRLVDNFRDEMRRAHGLELSEAEAKALLFSVNGGSMVEAMVVVDVLLEVERQLAEVLEEGLPPDVVQDYYGVVAVTRLLYARMLARHAAAYDELWLPRLAEIEDGTRRLREETREGLAAAGTARNREVYEGNLAVQERILDVIDDYAVMLHAHRDRTLAALEAAAETSAAATNTLRTIDTAAGLSALVSGAVEEFRAVTEIEVPEFLTLDDEEVFEQFLDISRQLSG